MSKNFSQKFYLSFLVSVSLFGLLFVTLYAVFPLSIQENFPWRKPLIGSVFGIICLLGIIAVFCPNRCSTIFQQDKTENKNNAIFLKGKVFHKTTILFGLKITHGHHPGCEGFTAHEFQIGKKTLCTACIGLLLGAFITLSGVAAYFFQGWNIGKNSSLFLVSGVLSVSLGLFQYMFFDVQWQLIRFLLNVFFVFGTFLVLASIDTIANSLILDFFVIFLCVFWLFTRISLSKHIHNKICRTCNLKCKL